MQQRLTSCALRTSKGSEAHISSNQWVKLPMLMLVALLLLSCGVGSIHCSTIPENSTDMLALLDFKKAITNDPGEVFSNYWKASTPYCQWKGVTCSLRHPGRVTALTLAGQRLSGPITSSVGNLTYLHTLDLSNNQFSGQIPHLNNLQKMQILNLDYNALDGVIPDSLTNCSALKHLSISRNFLVGRIPSHVGLLSKLSYLSLYDNGLTGIISPTLKNITLLERIDLGGNSLEGSIPDELGHLSNLWWLTLGNNSISGGFPTVLLNLSSLKVLDLGTNLVGQTVPPNIGDALHNLEKLELGGNMFVGQIPATLGNASSLQYIGLDTNNFTGPISSSFGKLQKLQYLVLENNRLDARDSKSWDFLYALRNCTSLNVLSLANNQLQGVIPNSVGNLSANLQHLMLGRNNLSGIVPSSIGKLQNLIRLNLNSNSFSGTVEEWMGNLKNLQSLNLSRNNFVGPIPSFIGNFTQITKILLESNKFEGPIPASLRNLKQLIKLYLSSNKLTGEIPDTLGQCQALVDVQMDQNFLIGNIPASLSDLHSLNMLNLSHNNLSGTIPRTLSELQSLLKLDLSYNQLHGDIPLNGVFANATAVSLDDNLGLCGGVKDLHMPSCQAVPQKIKRSYYWVKVLIPVFGFLSLVLLVYFLLLERKRPSRNNLELTSFGENFIKVTYEDLAQATRNFSEHNLVGRGSCGSVYRGKLKETKVEVAVKVFDLEMQGAERSFFAECEALRSIQHRNLLPIITACSTVDSLGNVFKALLYEFMPNGNLDAWIHQKGEGKALKHLGLDKRISIAVNIADALEYLHHDCGRPTVHCDLKPSNILLDDDLIALVGDFGIARFYISSSLTSTGSISTVGVKGTIGYIAPEYAQGGHVSTSGDVYSFGIVLLEIMTGKRPTDPMFEDGVDIIKFVESNIPHQVFEVVDAHLAEECKDFNQARVEEENVPYKCVVSFLQLALSCTPPLPSERMDIKQIASKLHAIKTTYSEWKAKN